LGGVCVFGPNIRSTQQLRALDEDILSANPLAVIAIDEEGGDVTRLNYADGSPYPGNAVLGRLDDEALTESVGRDVGFALRRVACTLDFAPDVDVNSNPDNPVIGVRSFGATASLVAGHGAAWTTGLQSTGIGACAKHLPGHGDTALDSHLALPVIDRSLDELRERELVPFRAAIAAGTRSIMTSHIVLPQVDPGVPATFSRRILQGILRDELGFEGVVVTDALDMKGASGEIGIPEAAVRALAAGCDLLCIGTETTEELLDEIVRAVGDAIDSGRLSAERVADAARRVRTMASELAALRAETLVPDDDGETSIVPSDRLIGAFEVREPAFAALRSADEVAAVPFAVVRIETEANIAVGVAPWGPFAQVSASPDAADSIAWAGHPQFVVSERDASDGRVAARIGEMLEQIADDQGVVVIGKALHRYGFAHEVIDGLRAARTTLAVDMGWPSDDRAYADIATFGASRSVGRALMALLNAPENRR
ncbi:MAG: glycoside hydrolase family 3 protein, partial [Humibacter sp.]